MQNEIFDAAHEFRGRNGGNFLEGTESGRRRRQDRVPFIHNATVFTATTFTTLSTLCFPVQQQFFVSPFQILFLRRSQKLTRINE